MLRERVSEARRRLKKRLVEAFVEEYSTREVAFSFSLGVFITALPTLGTGLLLFLVLGFLFERLSKIAMFASVILAIRLVTRFRQRVRQGEVPLIDVSPELVSEDSRQT